MLLLLFQLGADRYALESSQVVEVLPLVHWKSIPQAPAGVAGVFNYHGSPVPLMDLGELALGKPSSLRMSTRIIVVEYVAEKSGAQVLVEDQETSQMHNAIHEKNAAQVLAGVQGTHLLGLLAEHATSVLRRAPEEFVEAGVSSDGAPYLGPVSNDAEGIIQRVEVRHLLPENVRELLFRQPLEPV